MEAGRGRTHRDRQVQRSAPPARAGFHPGNPGGAQGTADHARRIRLPQRQRRAPEGVRPLHEPPSGQILSRGRLPLQGHRPGNRPGKHGGVLRRDRTLYRPFAQRRRDDRSGDALRVGTDRPVCVRIRPEARPEEGDNGPQGEYPEVYRRALPGGLPEDRRRVPRYHRRKTGLSTTWRCRW